jgi:hypothetical protein
LYSAAPFVVFLVCLRGVRLIQRREQLRRAAARAQSRDLARARRSAFCTDNNYYVLDLLGTKRGPYSLEKIVRWHDEGKLGDEQVIFVGEATAPVAFDDVAALWRSQWGESPFDPTPLRAVWPRRVQ